MIRRSPGAVVAAGLAVTTALLAACTSPGTADPGATASSTSASRTSSQDAAVFEGSGAEWEQAIRSCLESAGWPAVQNANGTWTWPGTENDPEAFERSYSTCESDVGQAPPPPEYSDEQYAAMYDYMFQTRTCLQELGYTISEPPTVQQWTDDYRASRSNGVPPWLPWFEMPVGAPPTVEEQCPQAPPEGWEGYFVARGVDA